MKQHGLLEGKAIPTLDEWLEGQPRADGYYEYVAESILLERAGEDSGAMSGDELAALRITRTLAVAFCEVCRQEINTHGRDIEDTIRILARCAGWSIMGPIVSVMRDDAPLRRLKEIVLGEIKDGAHHFVEGMIRLNEQERKAKP
jgi:hypothetical protein